MANNPNAAANLTPWKPGQSGNPKGRPPRLVTGVIDDLKKAGYKRVNKAEVAEVIELMFNLSEEELLSASQDKSLPIYAKIVATSLMTEKGGFDALEALTNRVHGTATQRVEGDVNLNDVRNPDALQRLAKSAGFVPAPGQSDSDPES